MYPGDCPGERRTANRVHGRAVGILVGPGPQVAVRMCRCPLAGGVRANGRRRESPVEGLQCT